MKKIQATYTYNEIFFYLHKSHEDSIFAVDLAGITNPDPHYRIKRNNKIPFYVIEYVLSGKGFLVYNGIKHEINAGDSYIIPPHTEHEYYSDSKDPWKKIWINCYGRLIDSLANVYDIIGIQPFEGLSTQEEILEMHEILRSSPDDMSTQLEILIHKIFLKFSNDRHHKKLSHIDRNAITLRNYINQNFTQAIKTSQLCKTIHRSESSVLRIFKKNWKRTPSDYIQSLRIQFAKKNLENTSYNIKTIARILNFADEYYFSNWFKLKTGFSPQKYRIHHDNMK
ncbi:MAG: AraC family transcriptional regulator [Lentisphaeria bacterium]